MKISHNTNTFAWDGHQIVSINPDYLENERRKISQMSYREAADYLLFESIWSVIFKRTGWVRKDTDGIVSYCERLSAGRGKSLQRWRAALSPWYNVIT